MAVSPSRRQFVFPAVSKWQSLSAEDSLLTFFHDRVDKWQSLPVEDSLFPQQSANGSLFHQKTVCSLPHSRVDEWRSPHRRQFVPLAIGKWQSFPKKRQFVYLTLKEIDKWQFLQTVCLFPGCLVPHRVDEWQFSH